MIAGAPARAVAAMGLAVVLTLLVMAPVAAHTGEGVSLEHVILEVGAWALAVAGVVAVIVGIFWLRARAGRR